MKMSLAATAVLVLVTLYPPQPWSRRASKLAVWTLVVTSARHFGLDMWVAGGVFVLVASDLAYGVARNRAQTLVQFQVSVPVPLLQDPSYRLGIESHRREAKRLKQNGKRRDASVASLELAEPVVRRESAIVKRTLVPDDTRTAGDVSFAGVPSVWRITYEALLDSLHENQRPRTQRHHVGTLGCVANKPPEGQWALPVPVGFGKARHNRDEAWLFYPAFWRGAGNGAGTGTESKSERMREVLFRVPAAQLAKRGSFLYLRKTLDETEGFDAPAAVRQTEALQRMELAVADLLLASVSKKHAGPTSVFAPSVFLVAHANGTSDSAPASGERPAGASCLWTTPLAKQMTRERLPQPLAADLGGARDYMWMQTLAEQTDATPAEWGAPQDVLVTLRGIVYWSTVAETFSIRSSYSFAPAAP